MINKYKKIVIKIGSSSIVNPKSKKINAKWMIKLCKDIKKYHKENRFVKVLGINSLISTNDVINTNNCFISICKSKYKNKIIVISAIDNLIKISEVENADALKNR